MNELQKLKMAEAQRIADRLSVTVGTVLTEWQSAQVRQREWMNTLSSLGYKSGDCPKEFLKRINTESKPLV